MPNVFTSVSKVIPNAVSIIPPRAMFPASWKTCVPRDRPIPRAAYATAPDAMISGTLARVKTLLIIVG